ncbi:hypothetical protein L8U00_01905 [Campylobacter sp. IFREMER_LSEM_CL2256]|uniref:hypothetical protein n=1 Tax=Campylobacter sp. IFREMER_LSEM_CL2256 TaxID=2911622 RepID=UPI0021E827F4|nr:hypothetical protein [Campylobacter sp. IFREMER_LSEM_CL2256]MCV3387245.1 hypothetical protein [Campylobacter sp. IFREMER_LSEM_CL2256]
MKKIHGSLCVTLLFAMMPNLSFATTQALYEKSSSSYIIKNHSFENQNFYDYSKDVFIKLNGKNYHGIKNSQKDIDGARLIYNNFGVLTPDIKDEDVVSVLNTMAFMNARSSIFYIPFVVTGFNLKKNVKNSQLILENGELSSIYYIKPKNINKEFPKGVEDAYRFIISPAFVNYANAINNSLIVKNSYINMGVENTETFALNGAPYIAGSVVLNGMADSNKLNLEKGSKIGLYNTQYITNYDGTQLYDRRIPHLFGGFATDGDAKNNSIVFNGVDFIVHGKKNEYFASSTIEAYGGLANASTSENFNAINNKLIINNINLDLEVDKTKNPSFYDAILFGEFFGGKSIKGNALKNKIYVRNLNTIGELNKNSKVQASMNFYGGFASNGQANENHVEFDFKNPFKISDNFSGKNYFRLYGGYATKGANGNVISIKNNLNEELVPQNYKDELVVYAARTLSGNANDNSINIENSLISLPLYGFITKKVTMQDHVYTPEQANGNKISLREVKSSKNLSFLIEAKEVNDNKITYDLVQSLSENSSLDRGSKIVIRADEKASNNYIYLKDYSSAAKESATVVGAANESSYNKVILENATFGTSSDKREGYLHLIGGVSKNTHHNIVEIFNINIDEYKNKNAVFIAASAVFKDKDKESKSYNNTLYLGGNFFTYENDSMNCISGTILHEHAEKKVYNHIAPHLENLSKNNHLILDVAYVGTEMVNNFEDFTFVISKNTQADQAMLHISNEPLNLTLSGIFKVLVKDNLALKNKTFKLIQSDKGFVDEDGKSLSEYRLNKYLSKMSSNVKDIDYKQIKNLKGFNKVKFSLEASKDLKTIYVKFN